MSYILDALKKSEHERQQHQSPTVHSIHSTKRLSIESARSPLGMIFFSALFVGLIGFGLWWYTTHQQPSINDLVSIVLPQKTNPPLAVTKNPEVKRPDETKKSSANQAPKVAVNMEEQPDNQSDIQPEYTKINAAKTANVDEPLPIIPLLDLPDELHKSLPVMAYSFHVYSTDPNKRTIIINNHRYREGEDVGGAWMLENITETGIVLRKGRDRTSIDVVDSWK